MSTDAVLISRNCDDEEVGDVGEVLAAGISAREAEVLDAVAAHLSNAQIARRLHISERTVESHVSSLLRKLGAADRRELAGLASVVSSPAALAGLPGPWTSSWAGIGNRRPSWPPCAKPAW